MRQYLNKSQKEMLLQWIAEGLRPGEINKRAQAYDEPFTVSRKQVYYYRTSRGKDIKEITEQAEFQALNTGLALKANRVEKLKQLAELMEKDLFTDKKLWLDDKKGVGTGAAAEVYEYEKFNRAEVEAYRGVLDDIARELGDRSTKAEIEEDTSGELHVTFHNPYANGQADGQ